MIQTTHILFLSQSHSLYGSTTELSFESTNNEPHPHIQEDHDGMGLFPIQESRDKSQFYYPQHKEVSN